MAEEAAEPSALDRFKAIAGIASNVAVIVGVAFSLIQIYNFVENSRRAAQASKLGTLQEIKVFLKQDEEMRRRGKRFRDEKLSEVGASVADRIAKEGSGEAVYLSPDLVDFAAVHYHYEQMGALVKLGYIDFPLVFEIITFPDSYMDATAALRRQLAANWHAPGVALADFGSNIDFLRGCYKKSRDDPTKVASCPR